MTDSTFPCTRVRVFTMNVPRTRIWVSMYAGPSFFGRCFVSLCKDINQSISNDNRFTELFGH